MSENNRLYRNIRKFELKYGFNPHLYADAWALALSREEMSELLGVYPSVLENFLKMQDNPKPQKSI